MFAVIKTGGKQYQALPGRILTLEKLEGEEGSSLEFNQVLMFSDGQISRTGEPFLGDVTVKATITEQKKDKKILIFKKKRRQGYKRKNGHRQPITLVHIDEILVAGQSKGKALYVKPKIKKDVPAEDSEKSDLGLGKKPSSQKSAPLRSSSKKEASESKAKTPKALEPDAKAQKAKASAQPKEKEKATTPKVRPSKSKDEDA